MKVPTRDRGDRYPPGSDSDGARLLTGWGRTAPSGALVVAPRGVDAGQECVAAVVRAQASARSEGRDRGMLARGLGRAYGDAAQVSGGAAVDMTALAGLGAVDPETRTVTAEAGVSLDRLLRYILPRGFFVPVTPGTRFVTAGGALASDVHGKNHHVDGSFSNHVAAFDLITGSGELRRVRRDDADSDGEDARVFAATAGGMGLTGIITRLTMTMLPVETSVMRVDTERTRDLDDCMDRMADRDDAYRYSVAWVDCLARGASMGRAVLTRGDHASLQELAPRARREPLRLPSGPRVAVPSFLPGGLLRPLTVRAFNEAWFRRAPLRRTSLESIPAFFYPLDGIRGWNRLYGPRGLVQYQFVVPLGAEETLRAIVRRISSSGCPSFLAVLKRFGPGNGYPLSFPDSGWTLAVDIPAALDGLGALLDGLDELVAAARGRVYLAKDGRLRPDLVRAMYPRLDEWRRVRDMLDPLGVFVSDLGRRLGLV